LEEFNRVHADDYIRVTEENLKLTVYAIQANAAKDKR
jgi:hypothetical protein